MKRWVLVRVLAGLLAILAVGLLAAPFWWVADAANPGPAVLMTAERFNRMARAAGCLEAAGAVPGEELMHALEPLLVCFGRRIERLEQGGKR